MRNAPHVLEFSYAPDQSEFSLLFPKWKAHHHSYKLWTFPIDITVSELLSSKMLKKKYKKHGVTCKVQLNGEVVDGNVEMSNLLKQASVSATNTLKLACAGSKKKHHGDFVLSFQPFVDTNMQGLSPEQLEAAFEKSKAKVMQHFPEDHPERIQAEAQGLLKTHPHSVYPYLVSDILVDSISGMLEWAKSFVLSHWGSLHTFQTYTADQTGIYDLTTGQALSHEDLKAGVSRQPRDADGEIRIGVASDWGAGTEEAELIGENIAATNPHWTIHVGDVYYVGTPDQHKTNCLGQPAPWSDKGVTWPHGSLGSFALSGNHEWYSRGYGYYDVFLPTLGVRQNPADPTSPLTGQKTSYVAQENAYWRLISLDTGYATYSKLFETDSNQQRPEIITWLRDVVKINDPSDTRGIVFFTHHQALSAFSNVYGQTTQQLADLFAETGISNKTVLWLWGHEHKLAFYDQQTLTAANGHTLSLYSRCLGNSGFPTSLHPIPARARSAHLTLYDDRLWELETGLKTIQVGYNGWTQMTLSNATLTLDYFSLSGVNGTVVNTPTYLVSETFVPDAFGNVVLENLQVIDPDMTKVTHA